MSDMSPSPALTPAYTPALSRRVRRPAAMISVLLVLTIVAGSGIWYTADVMLARPIVAGGFTSGMGGSEVNRLEPSRLHVPYTPGGTVRVAVGISNRGHFVARIQQITFFGIPTPDDHYVSPLREAKPLYASEIAFGELVAFRPFTIDPDVSVTVGWDLAFCSTPQLRLGGSAIYDRFGVMFAYGGWMRTDEVILPEPLSIDNIAKCDGNGNPPSR